MIIMKLIKNYINKLLNREKLKDFENKNLIMNNFIKEQNYTMAIKLLDKFNHGILNSKFKNFEFGNSSVNNWFVIYFLQKEKRFFKENIVIKNNTIEYEEREFNGFNQSTIELERKKLIFFNEIKKRFNEKEKKIFSKKAKWWIDKYPSLKWGEAVEFISSFIYFSLISISYCLL